MSVLRSMTRIRDWLSVDKVMNPSAWGLCETTAVGTAKSSDHSPPFAAMAIIDPPKLKGSNNTAVAPAGTVALHTGDVYSEMRAAYESGDVYREASPWCCLLSREECLALLVSVSHLGRIRRRSHRYALHGRRRCSVSEQYLLLDCITTREDVLRYTAYVAEVITRAYQC